MHAMAADLSVITNRLLASLLLAWLMTNKRWQNRCAVVFMEKLDPRINGLSQRRASENNVVANDISAGTPLTAIIRVKRELLR